MNRSNEPLSPEERELAARLSRLGGPREPAPSLDAAILAASRQAVAGAAVTATASPAPSDETRRTVVPLRRRTPMQRWPVGLGLAATMVMAIGIGWRLHGDGDGFGRAMGEAPAAAPEVTADAAASAGEEEFSMQAVILEPETVRTPPPPPPPMEAPEARSAKKAVADPPSVMPEPEPAPPIVETVPTLHDDTIDEAVPAAASAAAPPPAARAKIAAEAPAPQATMRSQGVTDEQADSNQGFDRIEVTGSRVRRNETEAAAPTSQIQREESKRGYTPDPVADGFYDLPPNTADTPEVRQAWLQRIRGLIADGKTEAARDSLQEFRRRYPDLELPEDLRKLAATLPPPKP